jgi:hypothetical protein
MAQVIESSPPAGGFVSDLKTSISAWHDAPLMPLVAGLLAAFPETFVYPAMGGLAQAIWIALGLCAAGWLGTSLIWYRRLFEGNRSRPTGLIRLTSSFIARYFLLIFLQLIPIGILFLSYSFVGRLGSHGLDTPAGRIGLAVAIVVVFFVTTFAYPALAYSTSNVIRAVQVATRTLIKGWPSNWAYAVVPATFTGVLVGINWALPPLAQTGLGIVDVLVALAFLGAIARYYLRMEIWPAAIP